MDAYLSEDRIADIFKPFTLREEEGERVLEMQQKGRTDITYKMHGDPSKSGANFGLSIAHVEYDDEGWPHVIFDHIKAWQPQDFPDNRNEMDYRKIEKELKDWTDRVHARRGQLRPVQLGPHHPGAAPPHPHEELPQARAGLRAHRDPRRQLGGGRDVQDRLGLGLVHAP